MSKKIDKRQTVIVCTCRPENYGWIRDRRLYNLPLPVGSRVPRDRAAAYAAVTHIAVYARDLPVLAYTAKYVREVDGEWLAANGYKREGRASSRPVVGRVIPNAPQTGQSPSLPVEPHADRYALFELGKPVAEASLYGKADTDVFVCSTRWTGNIDADFFSRPLPQCGGKSVPNIFERIRPFFSKLHSVRAFNPVQTDFFAALGYDDSGTCIEAKGIGEGVKYSMIDLFAGAGGLSEGLEEAGFHGIFASEIVQQYAETYRRNHMGTVVATADIRSLVPNFMATFDVAA